MELICIDIFFISTSPSFHSASAYIQIEVCTYTEPTKNSMNSNVKATIPFGKCKVCVKFKVYLYAMYYCSFVYRYIYLYLYF